MARKRTRFHPVVMRYCEDVLAGREVVGELTRLSVERFMNDLEHGHERGLYMDHTTGELAIDFMGMLRHHKGKLANTPIELRPHQQFYLYNLFGWKRADKTRRFRTSYKEVARKNGKTTECAGKAMFTTTIDEEQGAQVYFVATKEEQARIGFDDVWKIARKTPMLELTRDNPDGIFQVYKKSVYVPMTDSTIKPVGSDSKTQDGFDPHHAIIDEYHAHKTDDMVNIMESGMGAREQPLVDIITTAGFNKTYPCFGFRKMITDIMHGITSNDEIFGLIFTIDETDDWRDQSVWCKSNPNLGASVNMPYLIGQAKKAIDRGGEKEVDFKTKNLNVWTDAAKTWIQHAKWMQYAKPIDRNALRGRKCYGGLDLSAIQDFTAFSLLFPLPDGTFQLLVWLWIPEETVKERVKKGLADLEVWIRDGWVRTCPGPTIDYEQLVTEILAICKRYNVASIARDKWASEPVIQELEKHLGTRWDEEKGEEVSKLTDFDQGIRSFSPCTKWFEKLVLEQKLQHGGNPVLSWMLSNVTIYTDGSGNQKPHKDKSNEKIDGVISSIMALGEYLTFNWQPQSGLETHGIREL